MRNIKEVGNLEGKKVLVRVDWSVPMNNGEVSNDFQIEVSLPTIKYLIKQGAEVTLITHLESLDDSIESLKRYLPAGVKLRDNLRKNPGEINNDEGFARELASNYDVYVNEAFSVSHREHASIVSVPKFLPSYAGLRFEEEIKQLSRAFNPPHPFFLIIGGAKFETKIPLIEKFLNIADEIFLGGITAQHAVEKYSKNPKISFPHGDIMAFDVDETTIQQLTEKIQNSKFILWNGPLSKYEDGYVKGTEELIKVLAESGKPFGSAQGKEVILGGGDTLATIKHLEVQLPSGGSASIYDRFTFISTGGGAMLDFLANETLPGIEALN